MNKKTSRRKHNVVCVDCGAVFMTSSGNAQRCAGCRDVHNKERQRKTCQQWREAHKQPPKPRVIHEKVFTCDVCGKKYTTAACYSKHCPNCRDSRKPPSKSATKIPHKRLPGEAKTIREVIIELEEYNRRHSTSITYGKWVAMPESGCL